MIAARTLMQFGGERRNLLLSTIGARARMSAGGDAATYVRHVMSPAGAVELSLLIDDLTINETTFFRNVPQLDLFSSVAVPELIARQKASGGKKEIAIWSAACSTGQEVYTLAILACEALKLLPAWGVKVFGTDISPTVLGVARGGLYPKARLDTMPPQLLARYFDDLGGEIRVKDMLRRMTFFQQHNLGETFPPTTYDVIFCRNVMIYFSREEQAKLARKFHERLAPGGYLFIGHSESLQGLGVNFRLRIHERGVCYQKD